MIIFKHTIEMVGSRLRCVRQREMYKWGCFARRFSNDIEGASTTPTSRRNFPLVTLLLSLLLVMFMQNTEETFLRCKCTGNCNGGRGARGGWTGGRERGRAVNIHSGRGKFESNIRKRGIKSITLSRILSLSILVQQSRFDAISIDDLDDLTNTRIWLI